MPAYNAAQYIAETIDSVVAQSYDFWELIIVDDGSTDDTVSVISQYGDIRICLFRQTNQGVAAARNLGLANARGEFIAFIDSDDLWNSEKLRIQLEQFRKNKNLGLVYADKLCFQNEKKNYYRDKYFVPFSVDDPYMRILTHDFIPTLTVMIPSRVINEVGPFKTELFGTEDWDMWIRICKKYHIMYIDKTLGYYRVHAQGISKAFDRHSREEWKVLKIHTIQNDLVPNRVKNLALWVWHKKKFVHAIRSYQWLSSLKSFSRMIKSGRLIVNYKYACYLLASLLSRKQNI